MGLATRQRLAAQRVNTPGGRSRAARLNTRAWRAKKLRRLPPFLDERGGKAGQKRMDLTSWRRSRWLFGGSPMLFSFATASRSLSTSQERVSNAASLAGVSKMALVPSGTSKSFA